MSEIYSNFVSRIKKMKLTESLVFLSKLSLKMNRVNYGPITKIRGIEVCHWELAFFAKELLKNTSDFNRPDVLDERLLLDLHKLYYDLNAYTFDRDIIGGKAFEKFFANVYIQQLTWQIPFKRYIPRSIAIYYDTKPANCTKEDLSALFNNEFSISILDYARISFVVFSSMVHDGFFNLKAMLGHSINAFKDVLTKDNIFSFLDMVSIPKEDFRKISLQNDFNKDSQITYTFNFLRKYPIVKMSNDTYFAPIPQLLVEKTTEGLYYEFADLFQKPSYRNKKFPDYFGHLFEAYIGNLLKSFYNLGKNLFDGNQYEYRPETQTKCDWIVVEKDAVILIECKSTRFNKAIVELSDFAEFKDFLDDRYILPAIRQFPPIYTEFKRKFPQHHIYCLMICYEYFFQLELLKSIYYREFEKDSIRILQENNIELMSIYAFEGIIANLNVHSLGNIFIQKMNSDDKPDNTFEDRISNLAHFDINKDLDMHNYLFDDVLLRGIPHKYKTLDDCND